jgi:hypothetical protein
MTLFKQKDWYIRTLILFLCIGYSGITYAAGSCTQTPTASSTTQEYPSDHPVIRWEWTSASGSVNDSSCISNRPLDHYLEHCEVDPDADAAPDANYDIEVLNAFGYDLLGGQGDNLSATAIEGVMPMMDGAYYTPHVKGTAELRVSNTGGDDAGVVECHFARKYSPLTGK